MVKIAQEDKRKVLSLVCAKKDCGKPQQHWWHHSCGVAYVSLMCASALTRLSRMLSKTVSKEVKQDFIRQDFHSMFCSIPSSPPEETNDALTSSTHFRQQHKSTVAFLRKLACHYRLIRSGAVKFQAQSENSFPHHANILPTQPSGSICASNHEPIFLFSMPCDWLKAQGNWTYFFLQL